MHVAVLGASGKGGSEIVKELVARGHTVTGIARSPDAIPQLDGVTAKAGDASKPAELAAHLAGADAVISAIHFNVSCETLLTAVRQADADRLLIMGGAASLLGPDGVKLFDSPNFPEEIKPMVKPAIDFLEELRGETEIDWTFFSPAMMIFEGDRKGPGSFRLGGDELVTDADGNSKISYADYAIAMVDELEQHQHSRKRFTAAY
ncbi:NAD(P)-dependent oxidoreductase [Aurantiacibacter rhizosphaerae]|uniref:NAD(P)H-binding protein n=1 Tax=Aurantiacibacter rhizosphaerae TaxID=2691582 RepID=A0A844XF42_9SPHN|nr:NAD(P)H-binding protein [Aurantiacibacter rhizosphaerae]MWV28282.1 NAD(P)H-binding protein [Aurantiacibacter rhizosphaerae]